MLNIWYLSTTNYFDKNNIQFIDNDFFLKFILENKNILKIKDFQNYLNFLNKLNLTKISNNKKNIILPLACFLSYKFKINLNIQGYNISNEEEDLIKYYLTK